MSADVEIARRFIAALEAGDADAASRLFHPDALIWHNFDNATQTVAQNMASFDWMMRRSQSLHYDLRRLEEISDGYLQQHTLRVVMNDGNTVETEALALVTVKDGLIARIDEYIDPAPMAALAGQDSTPRHETGPAKAATSDSANQANANQANANQASANQEGSLHKDAS